MEEDGLRPLARPAGHHRDHYAGHHLEGEVDLVSGHPEFFHLA